MDLEQLVAIDVHVHAQEVADHYRVRRIAAVIFTVDDEAGMGHEIRGVG